MTTLSTRRLSFEGGLRANLIRLGRWEVYSRIERRDHRWAWLAFVKDGPSVEFIAGPAAVTVSWGVGTAEDPVRVWAWRRARRTVPGGASVKGG